MNSVNNIELISAVERLKSSRIIKKDAEISDMTGFSKSVVSNYLNNRVAVSKNFMIKFQEVFGIIENKNNVFKKSHFQAPNLGIPVYDVEFSAGFIEQIRDSKVEILTYINIPEVQGCDCVIRAKGDSMADYINNMDWIGIRRIQDTQVVAYGQPYAIVTKDLQLIKYIRKGSPGNYLLKSENENFDDFELPIAKVLELYIIKTILKIKPLI